VTDSQSVLQTLGGGNDDILDCNEPVRIGGNKIVMDDMCPDWDVLIHIQEFLFLLLEIILKFIKGHQDCDTAYAQL
jgi:hypothetical protein